MNVLMWTSIRRSSTRRHSQFAYIDSYSYEGQKERKVVVVMVVVERGGRKGIVTKGKRGTG